MRRFFTTCFMLYCVLICGCVAPYYDAVKHSNSARVAVGADRARISLDLIKQQTTVIDYKYSIIVEMLKSGVLNKNKIVEFSVSDQPDVIVGDIPAGGGVQGVTVYQQDNSKEMFFSLVSSLQTDMAIMQRQMDVAINIPEVKAHPVYDTASKIIDSIAPIGTILAGGWAAKEIVKATGAIAGQNQNTTNQNSGNTSNNTKTETNTYDNDTQELQANTDNSVKEYDLSETNTHHTYTNSNNPVSNSYNPDSSDSSVSTTTNTESPVVVPPVEITPTIIQPVITPGVNQ